MRILKILSLTLIVSSLSISNSFAIGIPNSKYTLEKSNIKKSINFQSDEYVPEEVKSDLEKEQNMYFLKKKTIKKYEIAISNEKGEYFYLESTNNLEDAIKRVKELEKSKKNTTEEIPVIIDKDGVVIYATESIGRLVRLKDGKPDSDRRYNVNVYSTATSTNEITYVNHGYMDDMPIIDQTIDRVKVEINGVVGWINKKDGDVTNVVQVPLNQANNLSYYKKSGNDLIHYMSSDITSSGGYSIQIGKAPEFMKEGVKYYSYDGNYFYDKIEVLLQDAENNTHLNSINATDKYYNYYQYVPGRTKTSYTSNDINNYIENNTPSNSIMREQGHAFVKAQEKYGVNASIIVGIAMNESGKGTSSIATSKNNIFGLNAVDSSPNESANYFESVEQCINEFASHWMSKGYYNPTDWRYEGSSLGNKGLGVNVRYASDPYWGEKASQYMYQMDKYISDGEVEEHNKYKLGIIESTASVTNNNGSELYKGEKGQVVAIVSDSSEQYKINGDRQVDTKPINGDYKWDTSIYIDSDNIEIITQSYEGALNQSQIEVINEFEDFYIYGNFAKPTIDLSDKNDLIDTESQAKGILKTIVDGKKYDRQYFLDAWNKLSSTEKQHPKMQEIYNEYNKIVSIVEAAKESYAFYNNITSNIEDIRYDRVQAIKLNNKDNTESGARGLAYKEYYEAVKYGEDKNSSKRMEYIYSKYVDTLNFLETVEFLIDNKVEDANTELNKIKDEVLNSKASQNIKEYTSKYNYNKREVIDRFERFYIYGSLDNPIIDLSDKNDLIETESQAKGILKTIVSGKKYDRQYFLDAWSKLSSIEKQDPNMQEIYSEYNKIINIVEAAKESYAFYNNITSNIEELQHNRIEAIKLNDKDNRESGARGLAYKEYYEAVKYGEDKNSSERMEYIYSKYVDTLNFLETVEFLIDNRVEDANTELNKIKDKTLNSKASQNIKEYTSKYNYNEREVIDRFERFYIYGPLDKPVIDLSDKNDLIETESQAKGILKTVVDGKKYDRQYFLDAWNKLSISEKNNERMKEIYNEYNKIISIAEAAKACYQFFNNVTEKADYLMKNGEEAEKLNSKDNKSVGARGYAYENYMNATTYGENSKTSLRMKYINQKYLDAINFLDVSIYMENKDYKNAKLELDKIKDETLRNIASRYI